jgi:hypothetical protein
VCLRWTSSPDDTEPDAGKVRELKARAEQIADAALDDYFGPTEGAAMSLDGHWTRLEQLGVYSAVSNAFANPDDCFAFMDQNAGSLFADAQRCHVTHGRGVVLLQGPSPFIRSCYAVPTREALEAFGPEAVEDFDHYDPGAEMLVGVTDPEESLVQFWRCDWR